MLDLAQAQQIIDQVNQIDQVDDALLATDLLEKVYNRLLACDGYSIQSSRRTIDQGWDFVASNGLETLGVQINHFRPTGRLVGRDVLSYLTVMAAKADRMNRWHLVSTTGFTEATIEAVKDVPNSITVQLVALDDLRNWATRLASPAPVATVTELMNQLCYGLARSVANNPRALDQIEWRELEKLLAHVLDRLGFDVVLTPPSKDGGKDVIASCVLSGHQHTYIVEIKHWRSGKLVGDNEVNEFIQVVTSENRTHGLFISSSGFNSSVVERLLDIRKSKVTLDGEAKIVALCKSYERNQSGLWTTSPPLPEVFLRSLTYVDE
jgi:restriction system protein